MTVLPTGIELPEEGGDDYAWDNILNDNWTMMDTMVRQVVALDNTQNPIGTVKMIPVTAEVPAQWELATEHNARVLVGAGGSISDGSSGGTTEWDAAGNTGSAGGHAHGDAGAHQHDATGNHAHGSVGGHNHGALTGADELLKSDLPRLNVISSADSQKYNQWVQVVGTGAWNIPNVGSGGNCALMDAVTDSNGATDHRHSISDGGAHSHPATGSHQHSAEADHNHGSVADHVHGISTAKWTAPGRWIKRVRDMTLADFKSLTPVSGV